MMRKTRRTIDRELLELFGDDPEGLAIVDAIASTQRVRDHRALWRSRPVLLAAVVVVVAIVAGALSLSASRAGTIQRAFKAVSAGDLLHLRLVDQRLAAEIVDLGSGERRPVHFTLDEWLNRTTGRLQTQASVQGVAVGGVGQGYVRLATGNDAPLFTRDYRVALATGRAHELRRASRESGRVIAFNDRTGHIVRVILDSRYRPNLIRYASGRAFKVTVLPAGKAPDLRPRPAAHGDTPNVSAVRIIAGASVPASLSSRIPRTLAGLPLVRVRLFELRIGSATQAAVEATFGMGHGAQVPARYLRLTLAHRSVAAFGWAPWYQTSSRHAWLVREGLPTAFFVAGGIYESVGGKATTSVVVAAARRLSVAAIA